MMKKQTLSLALTLMLIVVLAAPVTVSAASDIEVSGTFMNIRAATTVYLKNYPSVTSIIVRSDGVTIIGESDATYPIIISIEGAAVLNIVDINFANENAFNLGNLETLNVGGTCSLPRFAPSEGLKVNITGTLRVTHRLIGRDRVVISGDGALMIDPGVSPNGVYSGISSFGTNTVINTTVIARSTLGTSGIGETTLVASNNLYLGGHLTSYGTTGTNRDHSGRALTVGGKVIYTNSNARVDLHPADGIARHDVTFSKASGVSGYWNVSPSSAIVSGSVADNDIVVDVGSGSVSVWLGEVIPPPPEAPNVSAASFWAREYINTAFGNGIIPASLQNNYRNNITRAEFCALAVALIETVTGRAITERQVFADDEGDTNIRKIGGLGIVTGTGTNAAGERLFAPGDPIQRQQAALILSRIAGHLKKPLPNQAPAFSDNDRITSWAVEPIGQMQATGIMTGSGGRFDPRGTYTREQSIITMVRMWNWVKG